MEHCLIQRILKNAEAFPERPAVVGQGMDDAFSYRELVAVSRRMAAGLFKAGVGRGDFVTIELPRKKEYIAAMLAAWMVGAAFAPLSPVYPTERLAYIRRDCGAKVRHHGIRAHFLGHFHGSWQIHGLRGRGARHPDQRAPGRGAVDAG